MSRRDTIIIAALLNAGLLVVLFTTALKTDSSSAQVAATDSSPFAEKLAPLPARKETASPIAVGDEVDQVLRDYAKPQAEQPLAQAAPRSAPSQQPSFADEIKTLTLPSAEATAAPSPAQEKSIEVVVKKGDVLEKIARVHKTTVAEIMRQNNLSSTNLQIGQVLTVASGSNGGRESAGPAHSAAASSEPKYYTVKSGDNPWTIAVKNHMKVDELLKLNNLDEEKARRLRPGDQIRIR